MDTEIKNRIVELIEILHLTKSDFAKKIGMTPNHLSVVLNNSDKTVSINLVKGIAREFDVNLNWLISGIGNVLISEMQSVEELQSELETLKTEKLKADAIIEFTKSLININKQ